MLFKKKGPSYSFLNQNEGLETKVQQPGWCSISGKILLLVFVVSNIITMSWALLLGYHLGHLRISANQAAADLLISPARDIVRYTDPKPYHSEIFQTNKYRAAPGVYSKEIDDAWQAIGGGVRILRLQEEEVRQIRRKDIDDDPGRPLHRVPDEEGGYVGVLEVFHLLHCLAKLRESQIYNWEHYKNRPFWQVSQDLIANHNEHCFDALRQNLMCYSDVTPLIMFDPVRTPGVQLPVPDFSSVHTCRNFDEILRWNNNNARTLTWEQAGNASTYREGAENHGHSKT